MSRHSSKDISYRLRESARFAAAAVLLSSNVIRCAPSSPRLEYNGITARGALTALERSDDTEKRELVLGRLETSRQSGFDWADFWSGFSRNDFENLSPSQRERVFALAKQDCTKNGFHEFSVFVLRIETGFEHVVGTKRACARPLDSDVFELYLAKTRQAPSKVRDERLAELLISQHSLLAGTDRVRILESLTPNQWESLLGNLLASGRGSVAAQLAEIHQKEFGGLTYLDKLIVPWLSQPETLQTILAQNNLADVIRLLTLDAGFKERTAKISSASWSKAMRQLGAKFGAELRDRPLDVHRLARALDALHLMELIPARALHPPAFGDQLLWFETALRDLEEALAKVDDRNEIMSSADSDVAILWIKLRSGDTWTDKDEENYFRSSAVTPLSEALKKKIRLHLAASDQALLHQELGAYCTWLSSQGLPGEIVRRFDWRQTAQPGCLTIYSDPNDRTPIEASAHDVRMAFDAIVFTGGRDLVLTTDRFDGSFIDATASAKHPDLPAEPTSSDSDALTFPILLGFRQSHRDVLFGPGTYYFIYHYTWRVASPGEPALAQSARGYPGGNVSIRVTDARSKSPKFTSLGGPGQAGVPARPGGHGSLSMIEWKPLERFLRQAQSTESEEAAQPWPLTNPTLRVINHLFENAERSPDHSVRLYLDIPAMFAHMTKEQIQRTRFACPGGASDSACWENIAKAAAKELWHQYEIECPSVGEKAICPDQVVDQVLPRLRSDFWGYIEPAGSPGPSNPDGPVGSGGQLWFGVSK